MLWSKDKCKGRVSLSYDRLVVNGVHYKLSDLADLSVDISPAKACEKEDENTIGFKGIYSPSVTSTKPISNTMKNNITVPSSLYNLNV